MKVKKVTFKKSPRTGSSGSGANGSGTNVNPKMTRKIRKMNLNKVNKAKTRRGKKALEKREPQLTEDVKKVTFCRSSTANQAGLQLMHDLYALKKPNAIMLNKKEDWRPFENSTNLEFVLKKSNSSLFCYASHSKKRPNNLVFGRTFDETILDMIEIGFDNFKSLKEFEESKISLGTKPIVIFSGEKFEIVPDYQRIKSYFLDFFSGPNVDQVNLNGLEHVLHFTEVDGVIHLRSYRIMLKKSGTKVPRVELNEIGPRADLTVRRLNLASVDAFKKALKMPEVTLKQVGKIKNPEKKNISKDAFGSTLGRIHMERQDYKDLRLRKGGAFKAKVAGGER